MAEYHILDGEAPPEPRKIPWFRIGVLGVAIAAILATGLSLYLRALHPSEGQRGALMVVHCTVCPWADKHRVADITTETCARCGKSAGYGMRCKACGATFGYQPANAKPDVDGQLPPPTCPQCGSTDLEYLISVPTTAKPPADAR